MKRIEKTIKNISEIITIDQQHEAQMVLQKFDHNYNEGWLTEYENPVKVSLAAAITGIPERSIYVWLDLGYIRYIMSDQNKSATDQELDPYPEMVYVSDIFSYAAQCGYRISTHRKNEE